MIKKSSKVFFIQRWWRCFSLYKSPNVWLGADNIQKFLTVKNFPCLGELKEKDMAQDEIRITIEIINVNATVKKCGPVYKGRYFREKSKQR